MFLLYFVSGKFQNSWFLLLHPDWVSKYKFIFSYATVGNFGYFLFVKNCF